MFPQVVCAVALMAPQPAKLKSTRRLLVFLSELISGLLMNVAQGLVQSHRTDVISSSLPMAPLKFTVRQRD